MNEEGNVDLNHSLIETVIFGSLLKRSIGNNLILKSMVDSRCKADIFNYYVSLALLSTGFQTVRVGLWDHKISAYCCQKAFLK